MNGYTATNILDMIGAVGEDGVNQILSDFTYPENTVAVVMKCTSNAVRHIMLLRF